MVFPTFKFAEGAKKVLDSLTYKRMRRSAREKGVANLAEAESPHGEGRLVCV